MESTNSVVNPSPDRCCTGTDLDKWCGCRPIIIPIIADIARHGRWSVYLFMPLIGGDEDDDDDGNLHNLDTSSGKILFHASTRSDGEESGEDKREDRAGKKSWTNSLLIMDGGNDIIVRGA